MVAILYGVGFVKEQQKDNPDRDTAEEILREAEPCNLGPWGNHSRPAAHCAEKIAEYSGMDSEKAYVLGLLHDIGRKFGKRHLGHVSDGYSYMMSLRYDDMARICLTHSFNEKDIEGYVGNRDTTPEETELIKTKLAEIELDDYDKLIQLCDAISGAEGVMDIIDRMTDVKNQYGNYDQSKWDTNLRLKAYFEKQMGKDLYEAVDKEHFRPEAPICASDMEDMMFIHEVDLDETDLAQLIRFSEDWTEENSCYGYRPNDKSDIEGNRIFFAEDDGAVVGYLFGKVYKSEQMKSIMPEGTPYFEVEELYVVPEKRSQGIGEKLFRFVEDTVKTEAEYMVLSTATKNWKAIFHFYLDELDMTFWSARLFKKI